MRLRRILEERTSVSSWPELSDDSDGRRRPAIAGRSARADAGRILALRRQHGKETIRSGKGNVREARAPWDAESHQEHHDRRRRARHTGAGARPREGARTARPRRQGDAGGHFAGIGWSRTPKTRIETEPGTPQAH